MKRAPVPETAIYEKHDPLFAEDKVWFPNNWKMSSPAFHAIFAKKINQ
jgi:hypothetical protein